MSSVAIRVDKLSKLYHIGAQQRHDTLRDALMGSLPRIARISRKGKANSSNSLNSRQDDTALWALKDVSFEVKRGEVVGVIGRNGAGKSTLLKILSRITEPTKGQAEIHGRVGSLLEVGTGFHPELTGRENIYLNGAILGMKRVEIAKRFDEIVAFSEIERFLDTPVKRYSSGMYVRLAFAVAAHLEPEILLVDEVLAVGDAQFQEKCLGKMGAVAKEGRTVLFVSHNMPAVRHLCQRGLLLVSGGVSFDGPATEAVRIYLESASLAASSGAGGLRFANVAPDPERLYEPVVVEVLDERGAVRHSLRTGDFAAFRIGWRSTAALQAGGVELGIHTLDGIHVIQYSTRPVSAVDVPYRPGLNWIECEFPSFPLAAGQYALSVALTRPGFEWLYRNDRFGLLTVGEADVFRSGAPVRADRALVVVDHRWLKPEDMTARYPLAPGEMSDADYPNH